MDATTIFDRALKSEVYSEFQELYASLREAARFFQQTWPILQSHQTSHMLCQEDIIGLVERIDEFQSIESPIWGDGADWRGAERLVAVANSQHLKLYEPHQSLCIGRTAITAHTRVINLVSGLGAQFGTITRFIKEHPLQCRIHDRKNPPKHGTFVQYFTDSGDPDGKPVGIGYSRRLRWLGINDHPEWQQAIRSVLAAWKIELGKKPIEYLFAITADLDMEAVRVCAYLTQTPWILEHDVAQTEADSDLVSAADIGPVLGLEKTGTHTASKKWGEPVLKHRDKRGFRWHYPTILPRLRTDHPDVDWPDTAKELRARSKDIKDQLSCR